MRLHLVFVLLCLHSFCNAAFEIAGSAQCADCQLNSFKTDHAFSGLHVTIDCKVEKEIKRVGKGELDSDGKFKISLPKEIIADVKNKKCYAQLHSAAATPCPAHGGVEVTQIVFKFQNDGKVTFSPKEALTFSTALCTSNLLWPFFEYPPLLPKTDSWKKHWPQITIQPLKKHHWKKVWPKITIPPPIVKTLPPPVPIYKPKPKPKPPVVKPLPPVYKPKPKPKAPIVKPLPPVYKPKPKPKTPIVKPLPPIYKPKPKTPIVKPPTKPIPHPFHKPIPKPSVPMYKPPVMKPLPPPAPIYEPPVVTKPLPHLFPLPPLFKKPCPPIAKFPPKSYGHPKFGYFPKPPPFNPIP